MTSETVTEKSFLGVPVKGDITATQTRPAQRPIEELSPLFQAVLDDPYIASFGWQQYTPYFNDGEPCVFGVSTAWFRTVDDSQDAGRYDLEVDYGSHPTLGEIKGAYEGSYPNRRFVETEYVGEHESALRACKALSAALDGGEFDDVLQANFGDHAQITVTREGIDVEYYEHD
jgi:hypothetical protein